MRLKFHFAKSFAHAMPLTRFHALAMLALLMASCGTAPISTRTSEPISSTPVTAPRDRAATPVLQQLADEAEALRPLAKSTLTQHFLDAAHALPAIGTRTIYLNEITREYFSPAEKSALPAPAQSKLAEIQQDEYRYYYTRYGSPLAYLRPMELAASHGMPDVTGKVIMDFGYGGIGHMRILASLGAHVTGIDPDSYLDALYSTKRDQGAVPPAAGVRRGQPGTVALAHGFWPKDPKIVEKVGQGYDLILSKNTLKKGYIKPDKKIDKRQQITLGVSDDVFLKTIYNALNPGGKMIIYNIYPKQDPKGPYNPQADARSPFTREQYEKAGLEVISFNVEDHAAARSMGRLLKWDRNDKGEVTSNLDETIFAMYTIVGKRAR